MKKVALITGCSSGLGLATAVQLAEKGFTVYATMRNTSKQDELNAAAADAKVSVHVLQLDVSDAQSVQDAVAKVIKAEGRIDLLVNNAGVGFAKTTEHASEEEIQWVMAVNYTGAVRCVKAVLPQMREQKSGHIINVSSVGGLVGQPFNELYCAAKFALEGYTESMASYLTPGFGIHFSIIEPGGISSAFMKSAVAATLDGAAMTIPPYQALLDRYLAKSSQRSKAGAEQVYQTAGEVATIVVDVALDEDPPLRKRTSAWAEKFTSFKTKTDPEGRLLNAQVISNFL